MNRFFFLLCLVLAFVSADDAKFSNHAITTLTEDNFDDFVANELSLVVFYAPWCGHCKSLDKPFGEAAEILTSENILLGALDATAHGSVSSKFGVRGYPTMKIFRNGNVMDYNGPRDKDGIVNFMRKQVGPSVTTLTADEVDAFVNKDDDVAFVAYITNEGFSMARKFHEVADKFRDEFRFGKVVSADAMDAAPELEYEESNQAIVSFHIHGYEKARTAEAFTDKATAGAIEDFLFTTALGKCPSGKIPSRIAHANLPIINVAFDFDWEKNTRMANYYCNRVAKIYAEMSDEVIIAMVDKRDVEKDLTDFLRKDEKVTVWGIEGRDRFLMTDKFAIDTVAEFAKSVVDKEVEAYVKSEDVPETQGPVFKVVGKNFESAVTKSDKDTFLKIYAPWCGHCKALAPKWEVLAKKMKKYPSIRIADVDATANDLPSNYRVSGYPTIMWIPAGSSQPVKYEGGREVADFEAYIKENTSTPLKGKKKGKKADKKEVSIEAELEALRAENARLKASQYDEL